MTSLSLNFPARPRMQAYFHHAYTTGIMEASGQVEALANEYLQLELRVGDPYSGEPYFLDTSPWTDISVYAEAGLFTVSLYSAAAVEALGDNALRDELRTMLARGAYVEAYIDEYYFRTLAAYARRHVGRVVLIVGFDDCSDAFSVLIYRQNGRFERQFVDARELVRAISGHVRLGISHASPKAVRAILPTLPSVPAPLDLTKIQSGLFSFVSAEHRFTVDSFESALRAGARVTFYGIGCYDFLAAHVSAATTKGQKIDLRLTRLTWERSGISLLRAQRLQQLDALNENQVQGWIELQAKLHRIHLLAVQHNFNPGLLPGSGSECGALVQEAAGHESQLTRAMLAALESQAVPGTPPARPRHTPLSDFGHRLANQFFAAQAPYNLAPVPLRNKQTNANSTNR